MSVTKAVMFREEDDLSQCVKDVSALNNELITFFDGNVEVEEHLKPVPFSLDKELEEVENVLGDEKDKAKLRKKYKDILNPDHIMDKGIPIEFTEAHDDNKRKFQAGMGYLEGKGKDQARVLCADHTKSKTGKIDDEKMVDQYKRAERDAIKEFGHTRMKTSERTKLMTGKLEKSALASGSGPLGVAVMYTPRTAADIDMLVV